MVGAVKVKCVRVRSEGWSPRFIWGCGAGGLQVQGCGFNPHCPSQPLMGYPLYAEHTFMRRGGKMRKVRDASQHTTHKICALLRKEVKTLARHVRRASFCIKGRKKCWQPEKTGAIGGSDGIGRQTSLRSWCLYDVRVRVPPPAPLYLELLLLIEFYFIWFYIINII